MSVSRLCRFTPSGHIECLGGSHSRSAHLGEEKQFLHVARISARVFGSRPRRLVTIPTELSSYSDFLIGTQITSKIVGFCLCYVLKLYTSIPLKSSPTPVRSRGILRQTFLVSYTVIPRLTKIIRAGIAFVSRNPR